MLKSWGFEQAVAVERALPEYGNWDISHNVEYSLHPILRDHELSVKELKMPLTAAKLLTAAEAHRFTHTGFARNNNTLLATNACFAMPAPSQRGQGAYVAKSVSSLHKVRKGTGELQGLIFQADGSLLSGSYEELILKVIQSEGPELLRDFILTVSVVSNHGNWFTSDDHNKELKVLAQSYDWLLFLTDEGLSQFIHELLLEPEPL